MKVKDWLKTKDGKAFRRLLDLYLANDVRPKHEWLAYLCVDALGINMEEYAMFADEDFEWMDGKVDPKKVWEGVESWTSSDFASDALSLRDEIANNELRDAMNWWRDE